MNSGNYDFSAGETAPVASVHRRVGAWPGLFELVGILAFVQSIILLVLWLFFCAHAGAAAGENSLKLDVSSYGPSKARDPFVKVGASNKLAPVGTGAFQLQGILYDPVNPTAIVNDQLVTLKKAVAMQVGGGVVQVRALEITREKVVLEAGGQRVELRLNVQDAAPKAGRHAAGS